MGATAVEMGEQPATIRVGWRLRLALRVSVIALSSAVAGCQTASQIDTMDALTSAQTDRDPSSKDLAEGQTHFQEANYGLAEKHFRKAVELRADNANAWMGLAASYDRLGRFDFADRAYDQLLRLTGRQARILNNMGYSQYLRGNKTKAKNLFLEAKRLNPDDPLVKANLALL